MARWSWKGHFSLIVGKARHICPGLGKTKLWAILPGSFVLVSGRQNFEPFGQEAVLWAFLLGNRALMWYDSFSGKMVLKRPFLCDTGEDSTIFIQVSGRQSFEPFELFSWETEIWVNMIILVARWSWKGYLFVILENTQLICSGLRETELWAILLEDTALSWYRSFSGHFSVVLGKTPPFLFRSWEK